MKIIQSMAVSAVVLMFVLSAFAGTAAAAHNLQDTDTDDLFPGGDGVEKIVPGADVALDAAPEDRFLKAKKAFDGNANYPDSVFDGDKNTNYPDSVFDGDDDWQDGSDPVLSP